MKKKKSHNVADLVRRYREEFVVELNEELECGKKAAFYVSPLKPFYTFALGFGWIIQGDSGRTKALANPEQYKQMLQLVSACVTGEREWDEMEDGSLVERKVPVKVVMGREADPSAAVREYKAESLDFNDALTTIVKRLVDTFQLQWGLRRPAGNGVRPENAGGPVDTGGEVLDDPARDRRRGKRRAGRGDSVRVSGV